VERGDAKILFVVLAATAIPQWARAEVYLSEDQAASVIFPGEKLQPVWIELNDTQIQAIEKTSGQTVHDKKIRVFWSSDKKRGVFIDRVIGKHDVIFYAVGIDSGKIQGLEIMEYRETYGGEIRNPKWRNQFKGKTVKDPLKLDQDIQNISGATLSSAHVTAGAKRVLASYEILTR
jgi:Na+-translocating ferredoxin:NAD+ oxidoreductase RnfG subunit